MKRAALMACALLAGAALAQLPAPQAQPTCPDALAVERQHLLGLWRAEFEGGVPRGATLLLEAHPEGALGLRGAINRNGERNQLAGDLGDGEINLEESADGLRISAVWIGEVVDGSCGNEIRGAWQVDGAAQQFQFVLRKLQDGANRFP